MSTVAPLVVAVSGTSGAGKSSLVAGLGDAFNARGVVAVSMHFDDFAVLADLPADLEGWLARGGDPDAWRTDQMVAELRRLLSGIDATTADRATRVQLVIVEEPFGRARSAIGPLIDLAVHIDLPLHVALARRLARDFVPPAGGMDDATTERLRGYLNSYLGGGAASYQHIDRLAAASADLVLDGDQGLAALIQQSVDAVLARRTPSATISQTEE